MEISRSSWAQLSFKSRKSWRQAKLDNVKWAQKMSSSNTDVSIQSLFSLGGLLFLAGTLLLGSYQTMAKMADLGQGQPIATPVAILLMELLKLLVSAKGLTDALGTDGAIAALKAVQPKDFLMFGVPGLLYAFNNVRTTLRLNHTAVRLDCI